MCPELAPLAESTRVTHRDAALRAKNSGLRPPGLAGRKQLAIEESENRDNAENTANAECNNTVTK